MKFKLDIIISVRRLFRRKWLVLLFLLILSPIWITLFSLPIKYIFYGDLNCEIFLYRYPTEKVTNGFYETRKTLRNDELFEAYSHDKEEYCGAISGPFIFDYVYTGSRQNLAIFASSLPQNETVEEVKNILSSQDWQFKSRENYHIFGPTDIFQKKVDGVDYELEIHWNNLGLGDVPVANMNFSTLRYNDSQWDEKYDQPFDQITLENKKELAKAIHPKILEAKSVFFLRNKGVFNNKTFIERFLDTITVKPEYWKRLEELEKQ
jgi:hypothetical protein